MPVFLNDNPRKTLIEFTLQPGDLRENIVMDYDRLHELPSGTVIKIGEAYIRLTFHCSPCRVIQSKMNLKKIIYKRGVLGCFLNEGILKTGDALSVQGQQFEPIPYELKERLRWYLDKQNTPVSVQQLLKDISLPYFYSRAIPNMLKKLPPSYKALVIFQSNHTSNF